jgi:hypothetical protein
MASAELPDGTRYGVGGITTDSSTEDANTGRTSIDATSVSVTVEFSPEMAALEAAMDAAADASLRIYLVRQDAEAAAMIDQARAAGDALYAAKLNGNADAEASAVLAKDTAVVISALSENALNNQSPNTEVALADMLAYSAVPSTEPSASKAVRAEGCPEPWESNPKFSPCRKFMAEFCTLHGTDPRSRCYFLLITFRL